MICFVIPASGKQIWLPLEIAVWIQEAQSRLQLTIRHPHFAHLEPHNGNAVKTLHWPAPESGVRHELAAAEWWCLQDTGRTCLMHASAPHPYPISWHKAHWHLARLYCTETHFNSEEVGISTQLSAQTEGRSGLGPAQLDFMSFSQVGKIYFYAIPSCLHHWNVSDFWMALVWWSCYSSNKICS